ncbi:hypothetical protein IFM89_024120 [Coptis chinensis]|uniref:Transposase-associated domain-containing protein n=1 Tax=Coptis chinensis TaxID=261450 RepID=A0A835I303_9MAGN|nr:hypothetical protein IFM89_024120 [Coptis chinensis]
MRKFDPWLVFFKREWKRTWPFLVGFAVTGAIITKMTLNLTEEDKKNSPFVQRHKRRKVYLGFIAHLLLLGDKVEVVYMKGRGIITYRMSEPINKEWMSEKERGGTVYSMGVEDFLKFAKWKLGGKKCPCPCKKCRNRYWLTYKDVEHHLVSNGIEKSYCVWTLHGEDLSNIAVHPPMVANIGETTIGDVAIEMEGTEEETIGEVGLGWETLLTLLLDCMKELWVMAPGPEFDEPYVPRTRLRKEVL